MQREKKTSVLLLSLSLLWLLQSGLSQEQGMGGNSGIDDLLSVFQEGSSLDDEAHPYHSLTPTTPSPENINCYVEIVPPTRIGGVCKRLGRPRRWGRNGRRRMSPTWACQAGVHMEIGSPHCGNGGQNRRSRQSRG